MSRRKQARPIRHLDDEDGETDGLAALPDGQEEDVEASANTAAGKSKRSENGHVLLRVS